MSHADLLYWEDFQAGSVREFGAKRIDRDEVIRFATEFDPQPFHLTDEAARQTPFGGLVASGWHTCAMVMRMMCDDYLLRAASLGSPGLESLKWRKPVRPGDVIRVRMTMLEVRPMESKPQIGLVRCRWDVLNQDDDVVLEMEGWGMFRRRPVA